MKKSGTDGTHCQATDDTPRKTAVYTYLQTDVIFKLLLAVFRVTISNTCPIIFYSDTFRMELFGSHSMDFHEI
jgi:hypothetical protein